MIRKPWFTFDNVLDIGVDSIPVDSNVQISDDSALADGSGDPKLINVIDITGLGPATTIADLLLLTAQWVGIGGDCGDIDGGAAATVYTTVQEVDGGNA